MIDLLESAKATAEETTKKLENKRKVEDNMKEIKFINLTPHAVTIFAEDKKTSLLTVESSGMVRVKTEEPEVERIGDIPVAKTTYLDVEGLPAPQEGIKYIVSILVLQALDGRRTDVVAPNTSPAAVVRGENGQILGCTSFTVI